MQSIPLLSGYHNPGPGILDTGIQDTGIQDTVTKTRVSSTGIQDTGIPPARVSPHMSARAGLGYGTAGQARYCTAGPGPRYSTPPPRYLATYTPHVPTHHPWVPTCRHGGHTAFSRPPRQQTSAPGGHQAQDIKMEILSVREQYQTVYRRHGWPGGVYLCQCLLTLSSSKYPFQESICQKNVSLAET